MSKMKHCSKCKRVLPCTTEYFQRNNKQKSGYSPRCRECLGYKFKRTPRKGYKICTRCDAELVASTDNFPKSTDTKDGLRTICRKCATLVRINYEKKNSELIRKKKRDYYLKNTERVKENTKNNYQKNKEERLAYHKRYHEVNKEQIHIKKKEYRLNNLETIKKRDKAYRDRSRDRLLEKAREYRLTADKERMLESKRKYKKSEKGKINSRINCQKRRATKSNLLNDFTREQWLVCKKSFNNSCAYCGRKLKRLQQDHFVPLAKGGAYTANNIVPACARCNQAKSDTEFFQWYPNQPFYLKSRETKIISYLDTAGQLSLF